MIWIDTDMGFDDMLAVMMVARSGVTIDGMSLVFGNTPLDQVERNTAAACAFNKWKFPVFSGAARSVLGTAATAQNVLGSSGMPTRGGELPSAQPVDYPPAFEALCQWLDGIADTAPILALGPLTNVAAVLLARPDLACKISRLVWMGGSAGPGNHTASAEFNAFCDPEALAVVLASGIELAMVDLECCRQVLVGPGELATLNAAQGRRARILHDLFAGYIDIGLSRGRRGMALYDPVAAAIVIDETLADLQPVRIDIETAGAHSRGRTVVDGRPGAGANAHIATTPDADAIRRIVVDTLSEATEAGAGAT